MQVPEAAFTCTSSAILVPAPMQLSWPMVAERGKDTARSCSLRSGRTATAHQCLTEYHLRQQCNRSGGPDHPNRSLGGKRMGPWTSRQCPV